MTVGPDVLLSSFADIPHDSREKSSVKDGVHTHTFTNFPEPAESDDDTDKADVSRSPELKSTTCLFVRVLNL